MKLEDRRGLETSAHDQAEVEAFDAALELFLNYEMAAGVAVKQVVADHPQCVLAAVLRGYMMMMLETSAVHDKVAATAESTRATAGHATDRELLHLRALTEWAGGDVFAAATTWERILAEHPHDLLALKLHHYTTFWTGRAHVLLAAVASVIDAWDSSIPGYDHVLGMYAFGLNETGSFARAEEVGRQAVDLNREDLWSIHSVAHALEMQGALARGDEWFDVADDQWATKNPFVGHIWWHSALFPWNAGDYDRVLAIYDQRLRPASTEFFLDLQNLSSLLARLELVGVDVGDRWDELADHAATRIEDHVLAFTDVHCAMTLCRTGRLDELDAFVTSLAAHRATQPAQANTDGIDTALRLGRAFAAKAHGDIEQAAGQMLVLHGTLAPIGGSLAQRDLFDLLVADTALQAGRFDAASDVMEQRMTHWSNSVPTWQLYSQVRTALGDHEGAAAAVRRAKEVPTS